MFNKHEISISNEASIKNLIVPEKNNYLFIHYLTFYNLKS